MPSEPVDLRTRATPSSLPEWMDEPCAYEEFRQCLADLGQANRLTLAYRPTLDFLDRIHAMHAPHRPLRIVDVGSGGGDMLRRVERWAAERKVEVELIGIDLNPYAARAALELSPAPNRIRWITGDAFSYVQGPDVVLSSLLTHHLEEEEIVRFLRWMESVAAFGWFINDLCRERTPCRLFGLLARAMRWHRFVQHDGPVSFRRAFREADWQRMLAAADVASACVSLKRWTPARLCVGRLR